MLRHAGYTKDECGVVVVSGISMVIDISVSSSGSRCMSRRKSCWATNEHGTVPAEDRDRIILESPVRVMEDNDTRFSVHEVHWMRPEERETGGITTSTGNAG